jgi:hypothetical protein
MANKNGHIYGLTILSPIIEDDRIDISHALALRTYLAALPRDYRSPFSRVSSTHLARLVVMDDVVYVGAPACEEHLKSRYLVFETNFDGELDDYLTRMAKEIPEVVEAVWGHCAGYPGIADTGGFIRYMKKCQIQTTFFFADVNYRTVQQNLKALQVQAELVDFLEKYQGRPAAEMQQLFGKLLKTIENAPAPLPGGKESERTKAEDRPHE